MTTLVDSYSAQLHRDLRVEMCGIPCPGKELHWHVEIGGNPSFSPQILRRCRSEIMENWADMRSTLRPHSSHSPGSQLVDDSLLFDISDGVYKSISIEKAVQLGCEQTRPRRSVGVTAGLLAVQHDGSQAFEDKGPVGYVAYACR